MDETKGLQQPFDASRMPGAANNSSATIAPGAGAALIHNWRVS
jgi:hypothetical protein